MAGRPAQQSCMTRQATKDYCDVCLAHLEASKCLVPYGTYLILRGFLAAVRPKLQSDHVCSVQAENSRKRRQKARK